LWCCRHVLDNRTFEFATRKGLAHNELEEFVRPPRSWRSQLSCTWPSTTNTTTTEIDNPTNDHDNSPILQRDPFDNHSQWVMLPVSGLERAMRSAVISVRRYENNRHEYGMNQTMPKLQGKRGTNCGLCRV